MRCHVDRLMTSGIFKGRPRCDGLLLWPNHEKFLQATLYQKMRFLPFSIKNCKIQQRLTVFFLTDTVCN